VAAGFLLTAVRNWTGIPTLNGAPLFLLFLFWLLARLFILLGDADFLVATASFDLLFLAVLAAAIAVPVIRTRQWHNMAIVAKIVLLLASNLVFFLGVAGKLEQGVYWGLYSGLYIIIALIYTLSRRVLPFFIEKGVGYAVELRNSKRVDIASLVLFAALMTRVALPMLFQQHYDMWSALSQWLWLSALLIYFISYFPILTRRRVDGQDG